MVMDTTPQAVGREFVRQYYTLLHEAPYFLHRFYSENSSFVHGGVEKPGEELPPVMGQKAIHTRIMSLAFVDCHARIRQVDAQLTIGDAVVVQVSGELSNNYHPMRRFMQTFVLVQQNPKKYYVHNDIFRYQDEVFPSQEYESVGELIESNNVMNENGMSRNEIGLKHDPQSVKIGISYSENNAVEEDAGTESGPETDKLSGNNFSGNLVPTSANQPNSPVEMSATNNRNPTNSGIRHHENDFVSGGRTEVIEDDIVIVPTEDDDIYDAREQRSPESLTEADQHMADTPENKSMTWSEIAQASDNVGYMGTRGSGGKNLTGAVGAQFPSVQGDKIVQPQPQRAYQENRRAGQTSQTASNESTPPPSGSGQLASNNNRNTNFGRGRFGINQGQGRNRFSQQQRYMDNNSPLGQGNADEHGENGSGINNKRHVELKDTLYIGNLPQDFTEENLKDIVAEYGDLQDMKVHQKPGKPNYAFATFVDIAAAKKAADGLHNYSLKWKSSEYIINIELKINGRTRSGPRGGSIGSTMYSGNNSRMNRGGYSGQQKARTGAASGNRGRGGFRNDGGMNNAGRGGMGVSGGTYMNHTGGGGTAR